MISSIWYEDEEDLDAGKRIVQLIQGLALPSHKGFLCPLGNMTANYLTKMLRWSDYLFSLPSVLRYMHRPAIMVPKLDQARLQLTDVIQLMSPPPLIISTPSFPKVKDFCKDTLLHASSDASKVLGDTQLLQQFFSLPIPAVELHLACIQVRKAEVLHLLALWVTNLQDQGSNKLKLEEVAKLFRCEDMNVLCMLPSDAFAKIKPVCSTYLLSSFGDAHAVIIDAELLATFCKLNFAVVEVWEGLDELSVQNENDVAVLITLWYNGKSLSAGQLEKLSSLLRVSQLSRCFRCFSLPKLQWFKPTFDLQLFNGMLDEEGFSLKSKGGPCMVFPAAWIAQGRRKLLPAKAAKHSEFTASFGLDSLVDMLAKAELSNKCSFLNSDLF